MMPNFPATLKCPAELRRHRNKNGGTRMDFETSNDISAKIYGLYSMLKRQITIATKEMSSFTHFCCMKAVISFNFPCFQRKSDMGHDMLSSYILHAHAKLLIKHPRQRRQRRR